jgi:hypothetical protein
VRDAIFVLGGLAVVVFSIVRQRRSDRFRERSLLFPVALGVYGAVLLSDTSTHYALSVASAALLDRLRRDSRTDDRAVRTRRRAVGARVVDDDRSRLGWPRAHARRADRHRGRPWSAGCGVAGVHPADARDHAGHADDRRQTARQSDGFAHGSELGNAKEFSSSDVTGPTGRPVPGMQQP